MLVLCESCNETVQSMTWFYQNLISSSRSSSNIAIILILIKNKGEKNEEEVRGEKKMTKQQQSQ